MVSWWGSFETAVGSPHWIGYSNNTWSSLDSSGENHKYTHSACYNPVPLQLLFHAIWCNQAKLCSLDTLTALMTCRQKCGLWLWPNKNGQCPVPTGCCSISILFPSFGMHQQQQAGWGCGKTLQLDITLFLSIGAHVCQKAALKSWGIMLSEIIQTEKDKYCIVSLISGIL